MERRGLLGSLVALVAAPLAAFAGQHDVYYVSPDGDDANPGTKGRPFRTLQRAADACEKRRGVFTIRVAPGAYSDRVNMPPNMAVIGLAV